MSFDHLTPTHYNAVDFDYSQGDMKYQLVQVDWTDAVGADGWEELENIIDTELSVHKTVGFLLKEHKDRLIVTMSYDEVNEQLGAYLVIPKVNILKRKKAVV